eukprot:SAG31_NODE_5323_length_2609_cov_3.546215_2_plen_269_part_00
MDYFKKKKAEKKWKNSGPAHVLGSAAASEVGAARPADEPTQTAMRSRTTADDEAARARAAAAEARFGSAIPKSKQRPTSARLLHGSANGQLAENTDLPSRYIPPPVSEEVEAVVTDAPAAEGGVQVTTAADNQKLTTREQAEIQMALENSMADQGSGHGAARESLDVRCDQEIGRSTATTQAAEGQNEAALRELLPACEHETPELNVEQLADGLRTVAAQQPEKATTALKTLRTVLQNIASNPVRLSIQHDHKCSLTTDVQAVPVTAL